MKTECIICRGEAFADDIPMCYECALTVDNADDVFPPETHPTIKPVAYRLLGIIDEANHEADFDKWQATQPEEEPEISACPDCGADMIVEVKGGYEESTQYGAHCPKCLLYYSWWDTDFSDDESE